jgi:hexosaminidase
MHMRVMGNSAPARLLVGLLLICAIAGCARKDAQPSTPAASVNVIPEPREVTRTEGAFTVTAGTKIVANDDAQSARIVQYFTDLLQRTRGLQLSSADAQSSDDVIEFRLEAGGSAPEAEDYSLVVSPRRVVVSSGSSRGLFHGAVTLWQLLTADPAASKSIAVPAVTIHDSPRFRWRGLMLDSARHYQSPQFVKQFIDWMALHKLNVLHWHLTDDQAWRLEIRKYPKLTQIGAWRVPAGAAAAADIDPATGKPRLYGGFYSQDDVRDIVAYAAQRYITIVPEIETPGHASAAVAAYPQLGVTGKSGPVPADWGIYDTLYNVDDSTFAFLEDVLTEVMELFPGQYIHMGGDEAVKDQWHDSPKVQAQMRKLGIKDEHALQSYFVQRIGRFLAAHDRKLIGWDEILEGGLAPDATVMSWRGLEGAEAAAKAGHDTVLSPWPTLYFDNRQIDDDQPGRGRLITVEDVYRFDPAPASIPVEQRAHILGLQANLWAEHMRSEARVEYMAFPRAAALAEVAWSPAAKIDWPDFEKRLPAQLARYDMLGIRHAPLAVSSDLAQVSATSRTSHQLELCTDKLPLSLEDDAPLTGKRAVFMVDVMEPCWIWRGAQLTGIDAIQASVGQVPFNFQIGKDVNSIPLPPPQTAAGELDVFLDSCAGTRIASMPLAPALGNPEITALPAADIESPGGTHDLCFVFTRRSVDPIWTVDRVQLVGR